MQTVKYILTVIFLIGGSFLSGAYGQSLPKILDMQKRAEVQDSLLLHRFETVLPQIMRRENIDMWIVTSSEFNQDPLIKTMRPASSLDTGSPTLVFYNNGNTVERSDHGSNWKKLAGMIEDRDPNKIALNYSDNYNRGWANGISKKRFDSIKEALSPQYKDRIVSGENLVIGWLETRTASEMVLYQQIVAIAQYIIAEGFSEKVIQPGLTTTEDLWWWYRQKIRDLNLTTWFQPNVLVRREGDNKPAQSSRVVDIIKPGDMIWVDFGISYLGLQTDTQELAYVLKPGENAVPQGLKDALSTTNRLQDILLSNFKVGRTGNEVLQTAREQAINAGIDKPSIYMHPIGFHGHGAGPTIGLTSEQDSVGGTGTYPLYPNTAYSIELNATVYIPEWNRAVPIKLEEDAFFNGDSVRYIDGRQTEYYLIPRKN